MFSFLSGFMLALLMVLAGAGYGLVHLTALARKHPDQALDWGRRVQRFFTE